MDSKTRDNQTSKHSAEICSDKESEELGSPTIFENLFSDSENDVDDEHVIGVVGYTNSSAVCVSEWQDSHPISLGDSTAAKYSLNIQPRSSSELKPRQTDDADAGNTNSHTDRCSTNSHTDRCSTNSHTDRCSTNSQTDRCSTNSQTDRCSTNSQTDRCSNYETSESDFLCSIKELCPSGCSSCSGSSYTDIEDDNDYSDDDNPEYWKTTPHTSKKNKNIIPVRCTRHLNEETKNERGSAETSKQLTDHVSFENLRKSQKHPEAGGRKAQSLPDIASVHLVKPAPENFNNMQTNLTAFHHKLRQTASDPLSPGNADLYSNRAAKLVSTSSSFQQPDSSTNDFIAERPKKTCAGSLLQVPQSRPEAAESRSTVTIPVRATVNFYNKEGNIQKHPGTGSQINSEFRKNSDSMLHSMRFGKQPDSSVISEFELWNKSWSTVDFLICPNFLKGAPLDEDVFTRYKSQLARHRRGYGSKEKPLCKKVRIPRMFHKRVKKLSNENRDGSRTNRSPDVATLMNSPLSFLVKIVKESDLDIVKVMENADRLGLPLNMPCMQCSELVGPDELRREILQRYEQTVDGRCRRCGGQLHTFASVSKTICGLRKVVNENKFVIRDVYPDGNCMFGTVIDQLRVRGDFGYTIHTLRKEVVDYLRENPVAEDGTHFEMFLSDESWSSYLDRMSKDGQWGDHMVLSALANVLQTRFVIYGGRSGENETVITPQQKGEESSSEADSQAENRRFPTLYMGHFGETHYVSLRFENWLHQLQLTNNKVIKEWQQLTSEDLDPAQSIIVPLRHIDFILKNTFQLEYISSYLSHLADMPNYSEKSQIAVTFVGPIMCKMAPDFNSQSESLFQDISLFFPSSQNRDPSRSAVITAFQTPTDTLVQEKSFGRKSIDLLPELSASDLLHLRLLPVTPDVWKGQTMQSSTGSVCLRAVDIDGFAMEGIPLAFGNEELTCHRVLAFMSDWPEVANEWINRERNNCSPNENVIKAVVSLGCHVVPITSNGKQYNIIDSYISSEMINSQELWSYSFAVAETKLSCYLSNDQRCCFLLFKFLLDYMFCDTPIPAGLPKSVFYYACENIENTVWRLQPGGCLIAMLQQLKNGCEMSFIPHYFVSGHNLLQNVPPEHIAVWSRNIESVIRQPVISLYFVLDTLDITNTEIGALFDDILEDLSKYNCHRNMQRSFNETFTSASGTLIESLIQQGEFGLAMKSLEDVHEQICQISRIPVDLASVIDVLLSGLVIGYRWCFGLYIDLMKGSAITRKLSDGFEVVHITEIFGPNIDDEMPNTVVPSIYSIPGGDLIFPTVCTNVMNEAGKPKLVAKCLRYYIDSYSDAAGSNIVIEKYGAETRSMLLLRLQGLYMALLVAYDKIGKPEEFWDLMPNLMIISELRHDHNSCFKLALAWRMLGETENALHCCTCYGRHANMKRTSQ